MGTLRNLICVSAELKVLLVGGLSCLTPQKIEADSFLPLRTGPDANKTFQDFRNLSSFIWTDLFLVSLLIKFKLWTSSGLKVRYKVLKFLPLNLDISRQEVKPEMTTISSRKLASNDLKEDKTRYQTDFVADRTN
jgi:hypothetical protein